MAEVDRIPPVRRASSRTGPIAEIARTRVFNQSLAVLVGGHHLARPNRELVIVRAAPTAQSRAPFDVVASGDEQRRIGVQRRPRRLPGNQVGIARLTGVARLAVALDPGQVAIKRHPNQVEARQPFGQGRGVPGDLGIDKDRERHRVAGGVVGQHLDAG